MKKKTTSIFILIFCLAMTRCQKVGGDMADLIMMNGAVWTAQPGRPWVEAVAVKGNRVLRVGTTGEINRLRTKTTRVMDLNGTLVLPGFIDSHTHFLDGGFSLLRIQLRDARSREEFTARVARKAGELGKGAWILSGDWDHQQFDPPELPRKEWIDEATPENPVCVNRLDGHMVLVNSLALKSAGITKDTPSPQGGEIHKDPRTGDPTGILTDAAIDLVMKHVPEPSFDEKLRAAEAALRHAAELGVTSVHDMAEASRFEVYQELLKQGRLTCRIFLYIPVSEVSLYLRLMLKTPFGNDFLKIGGLKGFVDGSLGSATALFFDPYSDDPKNFGLLHAQMFPEGIMEKRISDADRAGLQVAVHAIGDKANFLLLEIFDRVALQTGPRDRRWRIEHAQHLRPQDIPRFEKLGVIASVQPYHAIDDGRWAGKKIGPERVRFTYAFQSLLENNVVLACGSDWPAAPLDPLQGIYAAATRRTLDGNHPQGWVPEEKISLEDVLRGYTINGAYAEFAEDIKGSIEEGKLADLTVLSRNIFKIPPEEIGATEVVMTVCDGKIVFEKR